MNIHTLPNGLKIYNATPHVISFWREDWANIVDVVPDEKIDAVPKEVAHSCLQPEFAPDYENVWFVCTEFVGTDEGRDIIRRAKEQGAEVIVGSIVAAQAYPGDVVAMTPCEGYEHVPTAEKRMRPDRFIIYAPQ